MNRSFAAIFLAAVAALSAGCGPRGVAPPLRSSGKAVQLARADGVRYLLAHQAADGAWRSEVYGHFRGGDALTPLVLSALLESRCEDAREPCSHGADYLAALTAPGKNDPLELSYPVYTAALAVSVLSRPEYAHHRQARDAWLALLQRQQVTEEGGWIPTDIEYGGWGYSAGPPRKPRRGEPIEPLAEPNLSATVFALEALRAAGISPDDPAIHRGLGFIRRCQNFPLDSLLRDPDLDDGGFFFLHHDGQRNKAGPAETAAPGIHYRSYGSTTADGLRALLACGLTWHDPHVQAAVHWLERNFRADQHPGGFPAGSEPRRDALYFYYAASVSRALRAPGVDTLETPAGTVGWAGALATELIRRQQDDGSWSNPADSMRENDPLLATSWAVTALSLCDRGG
jgi:squalene-hopene/tetraprenyl-beta-curcumene cyclase